jgi:hypothetical protein
MASVSSTYVCMYVCIHVYDMYTCIYDMNEYLRAAPNGMAGGRARAGWSPLPGPCGPVCTMYYVCIHRASPPRPSAIMGRFASSSPSSPD